MATISSSKPLSGALKTKHVAWRLFLTVHAFLATRIDEELRQAGCIPFEWHDVLMALNSSESPGGRLRMSDLAGATLLSKSGMSRRVERMEQAGLLVRERSETDGRSTYATLTRKGREALHDAWPVYRRLIEEYFAASMTEGEAESISEVFNEVLRRLTGGNHQYLYRDQVTEEPL